MLSCQIISNIRRVTLKEGIGRESSKPYRMWFLNLDDMDGMDTSPQVDLDDELATKMGLDKNPELVVGKKWQLNCALSFVKVKYDSIARIKVMQFVPLK